MVAIPGIVKLAPVARAIAVPATIAAASAIRTCSTETKTLSDVEEHINAVVDAAKYFLTWSHSEDRHISERVDALCSAGRERAIHYEAVRVVFWVYIVVVNGEAGDVSCGKTWAVLMYLPHVSDDVRPISQVEHTW